MSIKTKMMINLFVFAAVGILMSLAHGAAPHQVPQGGWVGDEETALQTLEEKLSNAWAWKPSMAKEFPGCVKMENAPANALAVAHVVVRHDVVVLMDQPKVASLDWQNQTDTSADDVKVLGNCY